MNFRWMLRKSADEGTVARLSQEINVPPVVARILVNRKVETFNQARAFLRPSLDDLEDPFSLDGMEAAVDRVVRAIERQENIMVFGDYDVDGITAIALLIFVIRGLGGIATSYIPHRLTEGYGLSERGIQEAKLRGVGLIISVDCGVSAVKEVEMARQMGMEVIVVDHHIPGDTVPRAVAILDPKMPDQDYRGGELAGVGVAFKLAQGIFRRLEIEESTLQKHLDLVALGTAADIVPLRGENRVLTKFGLEQLQRTEKPGLRALMEGIGLSNRRLGTGSVVFGLAPRINAVGRLGDAQRALRLLIAEHPHVAVKLAKVLEDENRRRREIDRATLDEAITMVEETVDLSSERAIVLASSRWHCGVLGIVASKLVERFHRPTVLISIEGDQGKGSARSIPGFHLHRALSECEEELVRFGGHRYAAGLTISSERIEAFRKRFVHLSGQWLGEDDLLPTMSIDAEIDLPIIDARFLRLLKLFEPFGPENMRPVFVTKEVEVVGTPRLVGDDHLKFRVRQGETVLPAIGFGLGDRLNLLEPGCSNVNMAFVVEEDTWGGESRIQLRAKDLHIITDAHEVTHE